MQQREPHYPTSPVSSLMRICLHTQNLLVFYSFHEEIWTAWYTDMTQKELRQNMCNMDSCFPTDSRPTPYFFFFFCFQVTNTISYKLECTEILNSGHRSSSFRSSHSPCFRLSRPFLLICTSSLIFLSSLAPLSNSCPSFHERIAARHP